MAKHKIALIPGDGIGKEVLPEGVRVLEAAARRFNFQLEFTDFDWSCDRLLQTGKMMPEDGMEQLKAFESIFLGAVGWPGVPDHVSLWGLLIPIRRDFDEYVNLRPVRLFEGVPSPLANRKPGEIDFWVVRENTEGEYSQLGGRMFQGTENEMAVQEAVFTRSEKGSVVIKGSETYAVPAAPVAKLVDTTGAGDLYASGFLFGYTQGKPLAECARLGGIAAAEVISHVGARPEQKLSGLI